ncbi:MAG: DUF1080 domain-containing protein [Verrucomicrobia bacterium]|nr:DUF1080 domain-containing protein [Verrucomicrobiota bacterium]
MKLAPILYILLLAASLPAADAPKPKPAAYLTEAEARAAGPDFDLQGEYADANFGAQVIALGDSKFRLVLHTGGLPGAGWDKSAKTEVEGALTGAKAVFKGGEGKPSAEAAGGLLTGTDATGKAFKLIKVFRQSSTLGAKPPAGAKILFDGSNSESWQNGKLDDRKFLRCGTKSKDVIQSGTLHLEFFLPFKPLGRGQDRGNSGVYLQDRYEVQVLDSFGLKGENNECGGIYSKHRPALNMCFPPLTWQTYDIEFTEAKFDAAGMKTKDATLTVKHNGVLIHDKAPVNSATASAGLKEGTTPGPIQLQDHGNPIYYRNIWWQPAK